MPTISKSTECLRTYSAGRIFGIVFSTRTTNRKSCGSPHRHFHVRVFLPRRLFAHTLNMEAPHYPVTRLSLFSQLHGVTFRKSSYSPPWVSEMAIVLSSKIVVVDVTVVWNITLRSLAHRNLFCCEDGGPKFTRNVICPPSRTASHLARRCPNNASRRRNMCS